MPGTYVAPVSAPWLSCPEESSADKIEVDQFAANLMKNYVIDGLIGRLGKDMAKTGKRLGMAVGLGTGPVF